MRTIDLSQLTGDGKVHNLSGRLRGVAARNLFEIDGIDQSGEDAEVVVPKHVYTLTPSFVQGLLGPSVQRFGVEAFRQRFKFVAPAVVLQQLERGLSAILTERNAEGLR